ncbi:Porphobilinogen synthase [Anaeromyxobacter dehalogenans 2CP-1]|uniref:Delta-aminolevulinic acid dehydratase n=1 Tax=Anaeromyxobacter dehalogenans (strain ATCC BAA-258 / DSM 21875 / 2CP-1) TaxID=455488 RepID=B8J4Z2_ANAD2|nr:porphobilinogen synthase [Anaeromyxobacter dehalogenans]ACL64847.1 Porphobilinogen synthase [Anaeromyxobacter dehalogenans 2CP-1]
MPFPQHRPRRMRRTEALRSLVRETTLAPQHLVWPLFVLPGTKVRNPVKSMPGVFQLSVDELVAEVQQGFEAGVRSVILFGIPEHKDPQGTEAYADDGIVPQAIRALKERVPGMVVMTDVCMCEYTDHGHCGILKASKAGGPGNELQVDNDLTLPLLAKEALAHARAGADIVAPSDMMDGRVAAIRAELDGAGYQDVPILSYAAKFAGAFYGPFRDAAESAPVEGPGIPKDRKGYQMDPANWREALREVELDVAEGADMIMVKPAVPYLDIVRQVRDRFDLPTAAYHVSGEYAMIKAAAERGWIDEDRVVLETLLCCRRAGADLVLTYYAKHAAQLLSGKKR